MNKAIAPYVRQPIAFLPYDPALPEVAAQTESLIRTKIPNAEFEHIGSTAILNMPGKNIINVQLLCEEDQYQQNVSALESLGFIPISSNMIEPQYHPIEVASLIYKGKPYNVHVLLTAKGSEYHVNAVFFRDYIASHPDEKEQYAK